MFGRTRKLRFEKAVLEEVAYMLHLHGATPRAVTAAQERAGRSNLNASRARVIAEAASRLRAHVGEQPPVRPEG
ncbi:MAG: hypothetical protein JWR84_473 [Caulobacter sp.]|nr:hypothetical protein [Caulobacter sp.]